MLGTQPEPVHGRTALFGVYGMLGLGLTLFCLRAVNPGRKWKETPLKISFWSLNFGLIFMVILSMLPVGLLQAWASIEHGTWYARSPEFMQSGSMQTLRWMRVPGDILFSIGAALFAWFVLGLLTGHSYSKDDPGRTGSSLRDQDEERAGALAGR
jgi:nitric oxide reductase subunit B